LDLNEFAQLCLDSPSLMGLDVTEEEEEEVVGCVEINQCVGCTHRAVRNRHRHAIEQASRRWRGGRRERAVKL
jgi:hypothetical protein